MSNITGNEPAMPFFEYNENGYGNTVVLNMLDGSKQFLRYQPGLTIRQELAARAMQGLLSSLFGTPNITYDGIGQASLNNLVADAVCIADALLTELNKS